MQRQHIQYATFCERKKGKQENIHVLADFYKKKERKHMKKKKKTEKKQSPLRDGEETE